MSWKLILKEDEDSTPNIISAGAIKTKFSKGQLPTAKEIEELVQIHGETQIRNIAIQNNFSRRLQPEKQKEKIISKSFSLFHDECLIINNIIQAHFLSSQDLLSQPSSSVLCVRHYIVLFL